MLRPHHLAPYGNSYGFDGNVAGTKEITSQVAQTAITAGTAALLTAVEGYKAATDTTGEKKGEIMVGPVPLNILIGAGLHAAAFFGSDDEGTLYGIDADYVHSAAAGAIATWAATRGYSIGKEMGEKAKAKAPPAPAPVPAVKGYAQVGAGGYRGYRPADVYANQFTR